MTKSKAQQGDADGRYFAPPLMPKVFTHMKKQIEKALKTALDLLLRTDADVLQNDVNERTISHRLANYLEPHFPGWNVDCEYNRNHDDPKRLEIKRRKVCSDDTQATTVFPDIIVHRRGTGQNLLVIEMKKTTSLENDDYDLGKLGAFKGQLGYQFAIFAKLGTGDNAGSYEIDWVEHDDGPAGRSGFRRSPGWKHPTHV